MWRRLLLSLAFLPGCAAQAYRFPLASEPHALLTIERVYDGRAGTLLTERVDIAGREAFRHAQPSGANGPLADQVRVHPGRAPLHVESMFSHQEQRTVMESYSIPQSYMATETAHRSESYTCGHNPTRLCFRSVPYTRYVTRTRLHYQLRPVVRTVPIPDAGCAADGWLVAVAGREYRVVYRFSGPGVCQMSCAERRWTAAGPVDTPCSPSPPPRPLERQEVVAAMSTVAERVNACLGEAPRDAPIPVIAEIEGSGRVIVARVDEALAGTPTAGCIEGLVRSLRFRSFAGPNVTIRYPFVPDPPRSS